MSCNKDGMMECDVGSMLNDTQGLNGTCMQNFIFKGVEVKGGDRFIPTRSAMNFDVSKYMIDKNIKKSSAKSSAISTAIFGTDIASKKILAFGDNTANYIVPPSSPSPKREFQKKPYLILAGENILDYPYFNLLDWSSKNLVAITLGSTLFIWNASMCMNQFSHEVESQLSISSLAWGQDGDDLVFGNSRGRVELWDMRRALRVRQMKGHHSVVGTILKNSSIITSGSRSGKIVHHDVRQQYSMVDKFTAHELDVCCLKWSPDNKYLASAGNDGCIKIWALGYGNRPIMKMNHGKQARTIAWCPWKSNVLASGGGIIDRYIKLWNTYSGKCTRSIDTKSQVTSILFSENNKEMISSHGIPDNKITVWKYPSMDIQGYLSSHDRRVLQMAFSPAGCILLSAGADEKLCFWDSFNPTKPKSDENELDKSILLKQYFR